MYDRLRRTRHWTHGSRIVAPVVDREVQTRWFADGSVIGGNPLVINLLWNEIGRGPIRRVGRVVGREYFIVDALTAAVFASESPQ